MHQPQWNIYPSFYRNAIFCKTFYGGNYNIFFVGMDRKYSTCFGMLPQKLKCINSVSELGKCCLKHRSPRNMLILRFEISCLETRDLLKNLSWSLSLLTSFSAYWLRMAWKIFQKSCSQQHFPLNGKQCFASIFIVSTWCFYKGNIHLLISDLRKVKTVASRFVFFLHFVLTDINFLWERTRVIAEKSRIL